MRTGSPTLLSLFLQSAGRYLRWIGRSLAPPRAGFARRSLRRLALMLVFLPAFGLLQLVHWLAFLLDEILYPDYRQVEIRDPVFVIGVPRSGTTHLHRVLAEDPAHSTFATWECLLAPSIVQRKILLALAGLDRRLGGPGAALLGYIERHALGGLEGVHATSLTAPEEDYLAMMPALAAFILVLPFPDAPSIWRLGRFDRGMPAEDRQRLLGFYRACLQKHLYVHGTDKRILSKNASFAPWAEGLRQTFPDARILGCLRDPRRALPSQLSAIEPGMDLFDNDGRDGRFRDRMSRQLRFYYRHLLRTLPASPANRHVLVNMPQLTRDLASTVKRAYARLELPMPARFAARLEELDAEARAYRSRHHYQLADYGLDDAAIERRFAEVYAAYDFDRSRLRARPEPASAGPSSTVDRTARGRGRSGARTARASGPA